MSTVELLVAGGLVLGFVQLVAGVAIGLWIGRGRTGSLDALQAQSLASDLQRITQSLNSSVREHAAEVGAIDTRLRAEQTAGAPLTELVVGVVGELLAANQKLGRELVAAENELQQQAIELDQHLQASLTDALTGLPNRRALEDHLASRQEAWRKHHTPFSVMMIDVDHFKRFNDTYGHQAGDQALRVVAKALRSTLRRHDVVARYGGEEFALLLPYTNINDALAAARKAIRAVSECLVEWEGKQIPVTASGGLATILPRESATTLVDRADQALYGAKKAGRNRGHFHTGTAIEPISGEPKPATGVEETESLPEQPKTDSLELSKPPISSDLFAACNELQSKLHELTAH